MIEIAPRITVGDSTQFGKPVIAGTRVPVALVIGQLAGGETAEAVMTEYGITKEDILAALAYAASVLSGP